LIFFKKILLLTKINILLSINKSVCK